MKKEDLVGFNRIQLIQTYNIRKGNNGFLVIQVSLLDIAVIVSIR